jgi:hypothetical protein
MAGVMLMTIGTTGEGIAKAQNGAPGVRPEDAEIRALIERGTERSATFRDLTTGLDNTNVVVYVRFSRCSPGVSACLFWASADTNVRRLLIKLNRFGRSPDELTALLAHELQHANEVASDSRITDLASFRNSFASGGWKHASGFETDEARRITIRVAAELSRANKRGRRQAAHERQASRREVDGNDARHLHQGANAAAVRRWWLSYPAREEGAEAPQARKPDFHTDVGYRVLARGEEVFGGIQARLDTKLVWRDAEDGLELADEMERRDLHLAGDLRYRTSGLVLFSQEVARQAEAPEPGMSQQHPYPV